MLSREAPDGDPVVQRLTVVLHRASRVLSRAYRGALVGSEISFPDYQVLRALVFTGPPYSLHPAEIARECGQAKSTVTDRLDLLEERGLLRRTADPEHRSRVVVELTSQGHDIWRTAQRVAAQAEERALAMLSDGDKRQLTELLAAVVARAQG